MTASGRGAALIAALIAFCALGASLAAGGADARGYSYSCDLDAVHVTQSDNRLDARGRLACTGTGVRRAVVRVCLLQNSRSGPVVVKCAVRARNGTGRLRVTAFRQCAAGPETGFISRVKIRIRQVDGRLKTETQSAGANRFRRDCTP